MKTRNDPRHLERIQTMQSLFAFSFSDKKARDEKTLIIIKHLTKIDTIIAKSAPAFPVEKIAKLDLAILRLAVYELVIANKNPPKVVIDEAVELAKEFGGDTSSAFVNGALGSVIAQKATGQRASGPEGNMHGSKSN